MTVTYLKSLQQAIHQLFAEDGRVCLLGEDLLDPYGGAFKVSQGLSTAFPDRVLTTPISEGGFTGVAIGMALRGWRPIVEIMFGDFLTLCTDQIVNHVAKFRGLYRNQVPTSLVIRTPMGGGRGYGATHSQSLEKMYLGVPGLTVVAPSQAHQPGDLLRRAVLGDGPVLFIENKLLYPQPLALPPGLFHHEVPEASGYPTAIVRNFPEGVPDVTVIAYGGLSRLLLPLLVALGQEEIRVTAVLPSCLTPLPLDTLAAEASRSGRVIIAEEGTCGFNWGSEVASCLYERVWRRLQRPIVRLASANEAIPAAQAAEDHMLISAATIEAAILEVLS